MFLSYSIILFKYSFYHLHQCLHPRKLLPLSEESVLLSSKADCLIQPPQKSQNLILSHKFKNKFTYRISMELSLYGSDFEFQTYVLPCIFNLSHRVFQSLPMVAAPKKMKQKNRPEKTAKTLPKVKIIGKRKTMRRQRHAAYASGMIKINGQPKNARFIQKKNRNKWKKRNGKKGAKRIGRLKSTEVELQHEDISRTYTVVIYHFARVMSFFSLLREQQPDSPPMALTLTNSQNQWIGFIEQLLSHSDSSFPDFHTPAPTFVLHPNSLHSVFQRFKQSEMSSFSWTKVLFMVFALFKKRNLLTVHVHAYLGKYWKNIIELLERPSGEREKTSTRLGRRKEETTLETEQANSRGSIRKQLKEDPSLAALQLAEYLSVCRERYSLTFTA